ncbi:MAG: glycosyltransferase family 39 protein [Methylovirgula sp.]
MLVITDAIVTQKDAPTVPRRPYVVLVAIVLAALVALRIALFFVKPLWLDEVYSGAAALSPSIGSLFADWISKDIHPPLYLLLLHFWCKAFGVSDVALRLPSLICDIAAIPVMYFGLRKTIGERQATIAALIIATAPNAVLYSAEARSYGLLLLLSAVAMVFALRLAVARERSALPGFTLAAIALALTHYFGLAVAGSLYAWLILRDRRNFGLLLVSSFCFVLFVLPWLIYHFPILAGKTGGHFWIPQENIFESVMLALAGAWGENSDIRAFNLELIMPLIATVVVRQNAHRTTGLGAELLLLLLVDLAILIAISQRTPLIVPRYFLVFTPIAAIVSGIYIGTLGRLACLLMTLAMPIVVTLPWASTYFRVEKSATIAWQEPAQRLVDAKVKSVIFFLDDPVNVQCTPAELRQMGEFFFRRAGSNAEVIPVSMQSPNYAADMEAALASAPRPVAILKPTTLLSNYHNHDGLLSKLAESRGGQCFRQGSTQSCIFR